MWLWLCRTGLEGSKSFYLKTALPCLALPPPSLETLDLRGLVSPFINLMLTYPPVGLLAHTCIDIEEPPRRFFPDYTRMFYWTERLSLSVAKCRDSQAKNSP
jgi:hypothetical protein